VLIQGKHLIEGGAYLNFPKSRSDRVGFFCNISKKHYVSVPQKSQKDLFALSLKNYVHVI